MLTDGKQTKDPDHVPLKVASAPLKDRGVYVHALGVGSRISVFELIKISSSPDFVHNARNMSELSLKAKEISKEICLGMALRTTTTSYHYNLVYISRSCYRLSYSCNPLSFH